MSYPGPEQTVTVGPDQSVISNHYLKDSIEAHLTIVFTALAIARDLQARSGWSLKKIVRGLRPLQQVTIQLGGQQLDAEPAIPDDIAQMLARLGH